MFDAEKSSLLNKYGICKAALFHKFLHVREQFFRDKPKKLLKNCDTLIVRFKICFPSQRLCKV